MLARIDERPEYSRIEDAFYITCLVCDSSLRNLLNISHDAVKPLGNVIGAASNPIHQPFGNNQQPRNFGTNAPQPPPSQNRRPNWFDNDNNNNDDHNDRGGGAIAINKNQNNAQRPTTSKTDRCNCGHFAARFICKKDGPNQNRPFLKCSKNVCKYFQWDDVPHANNTNNFNRNQPSGSGLNQTNNRPTSSRKCGICKLSGHNRKNCPNNN